MSPHSDHNSAPASRARRVVPRQQQYANVQVLNENTIGLPIHFPAGPYKGKTILTVIEEVQKPDLGRKYGQRDSRPLDPPPVVQVRLYEVFDFDTPGERRVELDVSDVFMPGLVCYAELFPYNADFDEDPRIYPDGRPPPTPIQPIGAPDAGRPLACANTYPPPNLPRQPRIPLTRDAALPLQLHGERHQNVISVPDIRGSAKKVLYFVFSELQVRLTGHFMLKYTAIHVDHTIPGAGQTPLLAECWGGVFAVYPSKQHPALRQSTDLTNHLSRCGSKLHSRHKQRVGRGSVARLDGARESPPTPTPTLPSILRPHSSNGKTNGRKRKSQTAESPPNKQFKSVQNQKHQRSTPKFSDDEDEEDELRHDDEDDYVENMQPPCPATQSLTSASAGSVSPSRPRPQNLNAEDHAAGLLLVGLSNGHPSKYTNTNGRTNGHANGHSRPESHIRNIVEAR